MYVTEKQIAGEGEKNLSSPYNHVVSLHKPDKAHTLIASFKMSNHLHSLSYRILIGPDTGTLADIQ